MKNLLNNSIITNNISNFRDISFDSSNNKYLIDENYSIHSNSAINFDDVMKEHVRSFGITDKSLKSVDSVIFSEKLNKIFFIEFKNGKIEVPETSQSRNHQRRRINRLNIEIAKLKLELIRTKVKDSITACCEIFSKNPDFFRENCYFILVYNEDKNSCIIPDSLDNPGFTSLLQSFSQISQTRFHNFGMDVLEKLCVDEVRTFTPKEFEDFIINYS